MASMFRFLLPLTMTLTSYSMAQDSDSSVIAPSLSPASLIEEMVNSGALGPLEIEETIAATATLTIEGDVAYKSPAIALVEPGIPVRLSVSLPPVGKEQQKPGLQDQGYLQTVTMERVLWEGAADDTFTRGGNTVVWRSGTSRGKASYVTSSIARLEASMPIFPEEGNISPAIIRSGRAGTLLLSGVAYDRNGDGMLFGENIGIYPDEEGGSAPGSVSRNAENYRPPLTFYRLDQASRQAVVVPPLTLGDLNPPVFEEDEGEPRFVPVSPRLLTFLEAFFGKLREKGFSPSNIRVLRGFVSPVERMRLSRQDVDLAEFTRYQYGDAVAVVYQPNQRSESKGPLPPVMGDMNGDGNGDLADVEFLRDLAKETMDDLGMFGGLGVNRSFDGPGPGKGTPCLHIDLRGFYVPFTED